MNDKTACIKIDFEVSQWEFLGSFGNHETKSFKKFESE